MTLANITEKELSQELVKMIEKMQEKGLLPGLEAKDIPKLAEEVTQSLSKDQNLVFEKADLATDKMRGVVSVAIMGQHSMNKIPGYEFDYKLLFKAPTPENQKELKEELVKLLKQVVLDMAKNNSELQAKINQDPARLDRILNKVIDQMMDKEFNKLDKKAYTFEGNKTLLMMIFDLQDILTLELRKNPKNSQEEQQREDRMSRYNIDTHNPGSYSKPVLANPEGNRMGFQDYETKPTYSFEGRANNPDYGLPDPNGTIWAAIVNFIGSNYGETMEAELASYGKSPAAEPEHKTRSPFSMENKPPGSS